MRKFYAFMIASLTILGCTREELKTSKDDVFYAQMEETDTKVYMDESKRIHWNANDLISIFKSSYNQAYRFKGETGATTGAFSKYGDDEFVTGEQLNVDANFALYPYRENTSITKDGVVKSYIPTSEDYVQNATSPTNNPMIAATESKEDNLLLFKNLCSWIHLKMYADEPFVIKSITLRGNNTYSASVLSGSFSVKAEYNKEPIIEITNGYLVKTLDNINQTISIDPNSPSDYYISFLPCNFENGFNIEIEDINGNIYTKETSKAHDCKRNVIMNMPTFKIEDAEVNDELHTPLTFTSIGNSSIALIENGLKGSDNNINLEYKINNGEWNTYSIANYPNLSDFISLSDGEQVSFRAANGKNTSLLGYQFKMTGKIEASGNIMSLLDNSMSITSIPSKNCFSHLFEHCQSLIKAPLLPATTLTDFCYHLMFADTSIEKAPELSATTLTNECYLAMFFRCTKLNYIKMLATDVSAEDCMTDWVEMVSSTGTFVKNKNATWDISGNSGIPTGWNIISE